MNALVAVAVVSAAAALGPCTKVRTDANDAAPAAPASSAAPTTAPTPPPTASVALPASFAIGAYACTHDYWTGASPYRQRRSDPTGSITLRPDGTYRWLDGGGTGHFRFDAASRAVTWVDGPLADKRPRRTTYRRNVRTSQIDITFADDVDWSCGHDL